MNVHVDIPAPYPYTRPRTKPPVLNLSSSKPLLYTTLHSHDPIYSDSVNQDYRDVCQLLVSNTESHELHSRGVDGLSQMQFGVPARLELFRATDSMGQELHRGANLFDNQGELICHIYNALLGYQGSGEWLSRSIMRWLGVSSEDIAQIAQSVSFSRYFVIISREAVTKERGVICSRPFAPVTDSWSYWHANA